ncbi:hypothetical protein FG91_03400 [Sphingopyxis sp. LC81]|uniref:hypothetical protein n=1 Tax=Sphingopyxis sp. LC81 TaxID=1502850 RepID=UPI00050F1CE5|nr:hypothetical protein [Sphingopyxis sp. LC81]KGB52655.1 hypothetical protein FG91_03400 [Sphingopyxis sp. LC81]
MTIKKSLLAVACVIAGCSEVPQEKENAAPHSSSAAGTFEEQVAQAESELGTSSSAAAPAPSAPESYFAKSDLLTAEEQTAIDNSAASPQARALLAAVLMAEKRDKRLGIKRTSLEEQTAQFRKKHDEDARRYAKEYELEKARSDAEAAESQKRNQAHEERRQTAIQCKERKEIEILRHLKDTGSPPDGSQDRSSAFWAECRLENL